MTPTIMQGTSPVAKGGENVCVRRRPIVLLQDGSDCVLDGWTIADFDMGKAIAISASTNMGPAKETWSYKAITIRRTEIRNIQRARPGDHCDGIKIEFGDIPCDV